MFVLIFITSISIGSVVAVNDHYQSQITQLKSELKVKQKRIDGLHEQVSRQTKRIAELTNNGG
ncbi:hypothetical protein [Streptococcus uberis]